MLTDFSDRLVQENPCRTLSLPALTTLNINLRKGDPSSRLTSILRSISSAPALGSITLGNDGWFNIGQGPWGDMDRDGWHGWLSTPRLRESCQ